jgi:sigma-B regulation protein RsbU (phosphoserine phosphatase)
MSSATTLLRAYTKTSNNNINRAIELTSEFLCNNNTEKYFVTLFAGILNIETNELTYINAGHNYPIIVSENSKPVLLNKTHMPPLGIIKPKKIKQSSIFLSNKDKLFLYTDGLTEAMNSEKELFTTEALIELLTKKTTLNPQELIHDVYENLLLFTKTADQYDDITMLCINTIDKKPKEQFQLVLNNVESLVFLDEVRVKIDEFFENSDASPKTIYRLVLVLEELITNTYKYGSTEQPIAKIEINIDDKEEHLNVTITDTGKPFDTADAIVQSASTSPTAQTIGKRGLLLVNKLTTHLNYEREGNRNKISFRLTKQ